MDLQHVIIFTALCLPKSSSRIPGYGKNKDNDVERMRKTGERK
jgi:hypothetical protein